MWPWAGRPGSLGRGGQGAWPLFLHARLGSTRALERFRNQVALQRWIAANVASVVALYEDRYELWGFSHRGRLIRRALPARRAAVRSQRSGTPSCIQCYQHMRNMHAGLWARSVAGSARPGTTGMRGQDVAGLRGVRYAVGLALEALDFVAPLLQRALGRLGDALAWLLVRAIGRSLGLVYRGVRESLALGRRPPRPGQRKEHQRPRYAPL